MIWLSKSQRHIKNGVFCQHNATIRPAFQSGAEKPFKMASPISYIVEGLLRISLLNSENWISKHWDISPGDSRLWGTPWSSSPEWVTEGGARIPITDHETASHVGDDSQDDNGTPGNGSERSSEGWDSRDADTLSATQCLPGCRGEEVHNTAEAIPSLPYIDCSFFILSKVQILKHKRAFALLLGSSRHHYCFIDSKFDG